ncbi:three-Cys-motif partner protein TcmP, partial [Pontibacter sp. 13R65]
MGTSQNKFGGVWTQRKIEIFMEYVNAYLTIMNKYSFKLIYFDGFAGCGTIDISQAEKPKLDLGNSNTLIEGVATKVIGSEHLKQFDIYYLVELDEVKCQVLASSLKAKFPTKRIHCVFDDCNEKLKSLSFFLGRSADYRALAFIDPFGMSLDWESLKACEGQGIDLWVLLPSGVAANRLLTKDGIISDAWMGRLERFLGLDEVEIRRLFYKTSTT